MPDTVMMPEDILREAEAKAEQLLAAAKAEAVEEAKRILADTRTLVEATHASTPTPLSFICAADSKIGDMLDGVLGEARHCYCCSAIRMGLIGLTLGGVAGMAVGYLVL